MKKYFAKYLPVEGEIKEREKFTHSLVKEIQTNNDVTPIKEHADYKKVKLFLCTRDIQVGDKIYYTPSDKVLNPPKEGFHNVTKISQDTISFENGTVDKELCFKVIGEISSEAIWVKEGDEFDIEELAISLEDGYYTPLKEHSIVGKKTIIKIKCSVCKTFH